MSAVTEVARLAGQLKGKPNRPTPDPLPDTLPATAADRKADGMWGFKSYSHFLHEVRSAPNKSTPTEFMRKAYETDVVKKAATGMGELVGSDGGFLVPPTFANSIFERVYNEQNLLAKTDQYTSGGNTMVFPRNAESSRATGSRFGGVRAYWVEEGAAGTVSAPTFGQLRLQLNKLMCLARVTEELIKDTSTSLESYLTRVFALEIGFTANNALYRGTGAGQPLGIINAPCAVSVTKETGQAAATIVSANIAKMWARRFALGPTGSYVWLINQDVLPQLYLMTLGIGTAGVTTFMPPGGLSGAPYSTLMGAPIMEIEFASTLGTVGDIALVDLSQIVSISQGMQSMTSLHVYFTTEEQAFRTSFRVDAAPWQASALTPFQGTNTQSPIILLATRS
jgi:HK97 family phage major capsid protein